MKHYSHCIDCCCSVSRTNPRYSRLESFNRFISDVLRHCKPGGGVEAHLITSHISDMLDLHPWLGLVNIVLGELQRYDNRLVALRYTVFHIDFVFISNPFQLHNSFSQGKNSPN